MCPQRQRLPHCLARRAGGALLQVPALPALTRLDLHCGGALVDLSALPSLVECELQLSARSFEMGLGVVAGGLWAPGVAAAPEADVGLPPPAGSSRPLEPAEARIVGGGSGAGDPAGGEQYSLAVHPLRRLRVAAAEQLTLELDAWPGGLGDLELLVGGVEGPGAPCSGCSGLTRLWLGSAPEVHEQLLAALGSQASRGAGGGCRMAWP